jgi:PPOX class probable F420-dependent enzyme
MVADVERLGGAQYVLVTTFRRTGTGVATPVWVARDGDELVVWSVRDAGKVKRIRHSGAVEVAECDVRGRPRGASVKGTARILDDDSSDRVRRLIASKYGVIGRVSMFGSVLRRGRRGSVGIAIRLGD